MTGDALIWCAKSAWVPTIRREHHLSLQAASTGVDVTFVQRPDDIRAVRSLGPRAFAAGLVGAPAYERVAPHLRVVARSALLPGHLHRVTAALDATLLTRAVGRAGPPDAALVYQSPWQWPPVGRRCAGRLVFDYSDDWLALLPASRRPHLQAKLHRICQEADEIVVVSPDLRRHFPGRDVVVVPNGVASESIVATPAPRPGEGALVYVGTLSERFDVALVASILERLPQWRLDLYGDCQYARGGTQPDPALADFLAHYARRVTWHGPIPRSRVGEVIDGADVGIIPNRVELSIGQSSMKLYDFAGRGRPTVGSPGVAGAAEWRPPGYLEARTPDEWAEAITSAAGEPAHVATERVGWARAHTWERRWPQWAATVFGSAVSAPTIATGI